MSSTYSFWVEPRGDVANALQQELSYLADAYGGPTFPPHVTLVGGITGTEQHALALATQLASKLQPYRITFDHPDYGSIYHQCIYLLCIKDKATMNAGKISKEVCGQMAGEYMPHLSLLYSDFDERVRSQAVDVTKQRQASDPRLEKAGFDVRSLHVYETDPQDKSCKTWKLVKEVPFAK